MPTVTQPNVALSLKLDDTEVNCQIIDLSLTLAGEGTGDTVEVACPDEVVVEEGSHEDGQLTGTVYSDTSDGGVSWLLMQAKSTGAVIAYELTWFADADSTVAFTVTGTAQVASFQMDWTKPALSRHPIDLTLLTTTLGRPA